jgi:very-short-patch-repair endonuclease
MIPTSKPADLLAFHIRAHALPDPETEHRFDPNRRWRFDFAWPTESLAVEVEGGSWTRGGSRHTSPAGFAADCEKYNRATLAGWRVLRVTTDQIREGLAIQWVMEALGQWEINHTETQA